MNRSNLTARGALHYTNIYVHPKIQQQSTNTTTKTSTVINKEITLVHHSRQSNTSIKITLIWEFSKCQIIFTV